MSKNEIKCARLKGSNINKQKKINNVNKIQKEMEKLYQFEKSVGKLENCEQSEEFFVRLFDFPILAPISFKQN